MRQRRSERFEQRSLLVPAALAVDGIVLLDHTTRRDPFTVSSAVLLTISAGASIVFGVFRGRTIELFVRDGEHRCGDRRPRSRRPRHRSR